MSFTSPNRTWVVGETVTASIMNQYLRDQLTALGRLGRYDFIVAPTAGYQIANILDSAWAECNAQLISRATYSAFDALLASLTPVRPFGTGDGTSTVNVPDLFGRAPVGMGSNSDVSAIGKNDGQAAGNRTPVHGTTNNLTLSNLTISDLTLPNHVHDHGSLTLPQHGHNVSDPGHAHGVPIWGAGVNAGNTIRQSSDTTTPFADVATRAAQTGVSVGGISTVPPIDGQTGNPTTNPGMGGTVSGGSLSGGVGPSGTRPMDAGAYQVAGIWVVKIVP